jgi:hypothetical protein
MEDIFKISQSEYINTDKPSHGFYEKKKHKKKKPWQEAKKHFEELTKIVEETHEELEKNNSPFRLCVYQEGDDIFIDVVSIDDSGNTTRVFKSDISHVELDGLIHQIKSGRGLILDSDV